MILAIDTSVGISLAVSDDTGQSIYEFEMHEAGAQGELTAWHIQVLLKTHRIAVADISTVIVGVGPGPFTGLRVGLATAEVFAFARHISVVGMCSLDAVGWLAQSSCVVVTNARRKELYWARYDATGMRIDGPSVDFPTVLAEKFIDCEFVGPGVEFYPDVVSGRNLALKASNLIRAHIAGVAKLLPVAPLYLREPDAVEPAPRKGTLQPVMDDPQAQT